MSHPSVLLIGGGNMGQAMLAGWHRAAFPPDSVQLVDPSEERREQARKLGFTAHLRVEEATPANVVVLAVKPQQAELALPHLKAQLAEGLLVTILAGKKIAYYKTILGDTLSIVRAMPNTPALIGQGVTACVGSVSEQHREWADTVLKAAGDVHWLDDEGLIDAVTALSGSGPAYCFLMLEAMIEGGVKLGLSPKLARELAVATMRGSAMLVASDEASPAEQRKRVTSPNGTTAAAIQRLTESAGTFPELVQNAMQAAATRAGEI